MVRGGGLGPWFDARLTLLPLQTVILIPQTLDFCLGVPQVTGQGLNQVDSLVTSSRVPSSVMLLRSMLSSMGQAQGRGFLWQPYYTQYVTRPCRLLLVLPGFIEKIQTLFPEIC